MSLTLGLLAAPGLARELAQDLARELSELLAERFPEAEWEVAVETELRAAASAGEVDLVRIARKRMLEHGWDLAICLTDLPILVRRRPVTAHASVTHGVGLISVPALGAVGLEDRVREAVLRLLDRMLGERSSHGRPAGRRRIRIGRRLRELSDPIGEAEVRDEGTVRFVGQVGRGNVRLLLGMVRANRPHRLIIGLSRALVAAVGTAATATASTGVWKIANGLAWPRLTVLAIVVLLATATALIAAHELWERSPNPEARERVALFNLATTVTIVLAVLSLYVTLVATTTLAALAFITRDVLGEQLEHAVDFFDYLKLGATVSILATIGGALGSALESDQAVREAAYGYRPDEDD